MGKIIAITGGCSRLNKSAGFQFVPEGAKLIAKGSFRVFGESVEVESNVSAEFCVAPTFKCICGNKHLYQCCECGKFVCYDGTAQKNLRCPECGAVNAVPAASADGRIMVSGALERRAVDIVLAIDTSSSMNDCGRMDAVKRAATEEFVSKYEGSRMAVVSFGDSAQVNCSLTDDVKKITGAINRLTPNGSTTSPFGVILRDAALKEFRESKNDRYIVVFTDGKWAGAASGHISSANKIKSMGINILAIGCAGADGEFLKEISSSPDGVIITSDEGIRQAFARVATISGQ